MLWGARIRPSLSSNQNGNVQVVSNKAHYLVRWDRLEGSRFPFTREKDFSPTAISTYFSPRPFDAV
jgi:hypothetical protein